MLRNCANFAKMRHGEVFRENCDNKLLGPWHGKVEVKLPQSLTKLHAIKTILYLTKYHDMKTLQGSGCIDPHILNLGTRWRSVASFKPRPLYPREKGSQSSVNRKLGEQQSRSKCGGREKIKRVNGPKNMPQDPMWSGSLGTRGLREYVHSQRCWQQSRAENWDILNTSFYATVELEFEDII
jgi:hypothetical protein